MKRYLAILLSVLLMMTSVPLVGAESTYYDDASVKSTWNVPCFAVDVTEATRGDAVIVTVSALNNPGIVSAKVKVGYDASVLRLIAYEGGNFSADGYSWGLITHNPFIINWCDSVNPDSTANVLAILTFVVLEDAPCGESPLNITFSCEDDVYNYDFDVVEFVPVNGEVYVLYPVTGVILDQDALEIANGETASLQATVLAEGKANSAVLWTSSNTDVAVVDENGVVAAMGLGSANITVTTVDGGYRDVCAVSVFCAHKNAVTVEAVPSTCTKPGYDRYVKCYDCGEIVSGSDAELPLAQHTYRSEITKAPTCEQTGVRTYTCVACGDCYTEAISATGHNAVTVTGKEATCTESGLTEGAQCSVCYAVLIAQQIIPATGHAYRLTSDQAPTCITLGKKVYTCQNCGDSYTDMVAALGHKPVTLSAKAPTCTEAGLTEGAQCSVCGVVLIAQQAIPTIGHAYDDVYDAECNNCGFIRDALCKHEYTVKEIAPTCTLTGQMVYTCTKCGDSYFETIAALGHKSVVVAGKAPTCTETGLTEGAKCSVCGEILTAQQVIPAIGHTYDSDHDADCNHCGAIREVEASLPGDANGDGKVNNRDLGILQQYLNEWDVTVDVNAADLNGDGRVNNRDLGMLQQLLNG